MIEVVLDTETTGLSIEEGHRIVEIGCIELDNLIPTKNVFHCYLNPERKVSESALKIHGYTDDFLSRQKKFLDIAKEFLNFINNKKLVIHNADFDISHLNNELSIAGFEKINLDNVIDTLEIARNKYPGSGASLDALCKRYRIDNSKREKHTALMDCELLSKVYVNLLDQKEPTLNFTNESSKIEFKQSINSDYSKKIIKPNDNEMTEHSKFLKKHLKKNFF
ncbi:MAG: DNA polymerase III subunit epsilon [Candidatus Pelagibacter sp. TMED118]|nr:MAG: DNA polymerase III subunit epsilon [Candidatus Pelagibacter sp. TMED118]|tara:strand:- start:10121 stop:10786 length:666 start_codon:yes stop_codon:yes gene_type:complete